MEGILKYSSNLLQNIETKLNLALNTKVHIFKLFLTSCTLLIFFGTIMMTLCRSAVFILRRNDIPVGKYTGQMAFRRSSCNIHPTVITLIFSHIFFLFFFVRIRIYFCSFDIVLVHLDFLELSMLLFMLFSSLVRRRPLSSPAWQV